MAAGVVVDGRLLPGAPAQQEEIPLGTVRWQRCLSVILICQHQIPSVPVLIKMCVRLPLGVVRHVFGHPLLDLLHG